MNNMVVRLVAVLVVVMVAALILAIEVGGVLGGGECVAIASVIDTPILDAFFLNGSSFSRSFTSSTCCCSISRIPTPSDLIQMCFLLALPYGLGI